MGFPVRTSKPDSVPEAVRDSTWRLEFEPHNRRNYAMFDDVSTDPFARRAGDFVGRIVGRIHDKGNKLGNWWDDLELNKWKKLGEPQPKKKKR